jgi:hypothetical protein
MISHSSSVADTSGISEGGSIGWGQLKLLHATCERVQSPQPSPPKPQRTPLSLQHHAVERGGDVSHYDQRPLTPNASEYQRKYQRMLAVVEERWVRPKLCPAHTPPYY